MSSDFVIHTGDALTVLRTLPDSSIDACITDPPYGDTNLAWDIIVNGWADEVARVLKPSGSLWVFASLRYLIKLQSALPAWKYAQDLVWEKHNGSACHNDRFRRVHEHIVQFYPAKHPWGGVFKAPITRGDGKERTVHRSRGPDHFKSRTGGTFISAHGGRRLERSVIRCNSMHGTGTHPTQKPEALVSLLVRYSCPPGGLILDPFAGSGTTGACAVKNGCRFIGIELDPAYATAAAHRIAEAHASGHQQSIAGIAS